jgi:hypothetical protein
VDRICPIGLHSEHDGWEMDFARSLSGADAIKAVEYARRLSSKALVENGKDAERQEKHHIGTNSTIERKQ